MTTIMTVIGARPQFVKAAMVSAALRRRGGVREIVVHTGQHYDANMSDAFFDELGMTPPDHNLQVGSGAHGVQTGAMLVGLEALVAEARPDCILTYGDTNSTLAAALVAAKADLPLAHVEAGLRSFNMAMPEEVNRIVTDRLSSILFAPTETAVANLRREGAAEGDVHLVGDVMYDAALAFRDRIAGGGSLVERLGLVDGGYALGTVHRAENTDDSVRLAAIVTALSRLSERMPVILPLHPRTRSRIGDLPQGVRVIDPVGYLDMVALERHARFIATDSGGVQKEAFFHGVPCVTLRTETEWVELVEGGWNRLVDPSDAEAMTAVLLGMADGVDFPVPPADLYGGGRASEAIVAILMARLARGRA